MLESIGGGICANQLLLERSCILEWMVQIEQHKAPSVNCQPLSLRTSLLRMTTLETQQSFANAKLSDD